MIDSDIVYEDVLDFNNNQQMVYKYKTRFLDCYGNNIKSESIYLTRKSNGEDVYIACFVGCTYHCA